MTDDLLDCDIIVVVAARGCERWVVLFDDAHREQAIQVVARWAESGICTWQQAHGLAEKIRGSEGDE